MGFSPTQPPIPGVGWLLTEYSFPSRLRARLCVPPHATCTHPGVATTHLNMTSSWHHHTSHDIIMTSSRHHHDFFMTSSHHSSPHPFTTTTFTIGVCPNSSTLCGHLLLLLSPPNPSLPCSPRPHPHTCPPPTPPSHITHAGDPQPPPHPTPCPLLLTTPSSVMAIECHPPAAMSTCSHTAPKTTHPSE